MPLPPGFAPPAHPPRGAHGCTLHGCTSSLTLFTLHLPGNQFVKPAAIPPWLRRTARLRYVLQNPNVTQLTMPTDINIIIRANAAAATEHANRIRAQGNSDNSKQSTITDRNNFQVNNRQGGGTSPTNKISRPEFLGGGKIGETLHIPPAQSAPRSNGGTPSIGHVPPKAPLAPVGGVNMGGKTDGDKGKLDTGLNLPSPSTTGEGDSKPAPVVNPQAPVRPKLVPRDGEKVQ